MKKTTKITFLLALASLLGFGACNSGKNTVPYYKISNKFKAYCFFNTPSYWIYQNDSTKVSDSLKVADINSYYGFHSPDNIAGAYSYDVIDLDFDTTNRVNLVKGSITAGNPTTGTGSFRDQYWLFFKNGNYLLAFAPGYPMGEEQRLGNNPGFYTNIEIIPKFQLNGMTYDSVYHTQVRKTEGTPDTVNYQFYFAMHYGLVKWLRTVKGHTTSISLKASDLNQENKAVR